MRCRSLLRLACAALWLACSAAAAQTPSILVPGWRAPVLQVAGAEQPVRLQALRLEVEVVGRVAQTKVTMEFFNPNRRLLEGRLQFPLTEGQVVTGFALDVDGRMRAAVPVEKARAQQVFEDISRRRVDPGLLQATSGNNYELRLYPLPPGGTRSVALTLVEPVAERLQVALAYAARVDAFELHLRYPAASSAPGVGGPNPLGLRFARDPQGGYAAQLRGAATTLPTLPLVVRSAASPREPETTVQQRDGATYFALDLPLSQRSAERPLPTRMQLVWDASGSASGRRFEREFALLDAYFRRAGRVDVNLVRVCDSASAPQRYTVRRGDWSALRRALEGTVYDGASNLGAVAYDGVSQEALWFTDGLANYGAPWSLKFPVPVYTVDSAAAANPAALRALAESSGGAWLDLGALDPAQAVHALLRRTWQLLDVTAVGARDVVVLSTRPEQGRLALAGVLTAADATLTLRLRSPDGAIATRTVRVGAHGNESSLAAAQWARIELGRLQADAHLNRTRIRELGRRFGLVTSETSLLVLERVEDYVEHEIEPPPSLRAAFDRLAGNARRTRRDSDATRLAQVVRRFEARVAWWATEFPKDEPPRALQSAPRLEINAAGAVGTSADALRRDRPAAPMVASAAPAAAAMPLQARRRGSASGALGKSAEDK
ncbi:MAG: VIT domain-containing protein, partial [Caldimonas sp.]